MEFVPFPEVNIQIAEDQDEYLTIPAHRHPNGITTFCWKLSEEELKKLVMTGEIWHQVWHTGGLQPVMLSVDKPELT